MSLEVVQPPCPPRGWQRSVGQSLGEGQARARRLQATEAPGLDAQLDWPPLPGQVVEDAVIPAMNPPGRLAAGRAGCPGLTRCDDDGEEFVGGQDLLDQQPCRDKRKKTL